ncbi:HCNGP-like protein-domain-containing protein [Phyllosticta citribraziliensis]|uniref:HCNGP-like protein-domain-containing protein n=1 Tax=Phyllosticta citribraziliensis TaxID=989973 RepID=A0ABR1LA55_9PEZI
MLGLDDYGSSEDEGVNASQNKQTAKPASAITPEQAKDSNGVAEEQPDQASQPSIPPADTEPARGPSFPQRRDVPEDAPAPGPAAPPINDPGDSNGADSAPLSPYSAARAAVRSLTMPKEPNFDIPPSPPGSPPAKSTAQFSHFLEIKKKGHHFNDRLENTSALRNPSLLQRLRTFAGIDGEHQYATTLPEDVALPTKFPRWAYAEELAKSQQDIGRKREEEQRKSQRVDFVPEGSSGLGLGSGKGTSMAERVRAGLSRESSGSPATSDSGKRKEDQRRDHDDDRRKRSRFDR